MFEQFSARIRLCYERAADAGHMVHYADLSLVGASVKDVGRPSTEPIRVRRV